MLSFSLTALAACDFMLWQIWRFLNDPVTLNSLLTKKTPQHSYSFKDQLNWVHCFVSFSCWKLMSCLHVYLIGQITENQACDATLMCCCDSNGFVCVSLQLMSLWFTEKKTCCFSCYVDGFSCWSFVTCLLSCTEIILELDLIQALFFGKSDNIVSLSLTLKFNSIWPKRYFAT